MTFIWYNNLKFCSAHGVFFSVHCVAQIIALWTAARDSRAVAMPLLAGEFLLRGRVLLIPLFF